MSAIGRRSGSSSLHKGPSVPSSAAGTSQVLATVASTMEPMAAWEILLLLALVQRLQTDCTVPLRVQGSSFDDKPAPGHLILRVKQLVLVRMLSHDRVGSMLLAHQHDPMVAILVLVEANRDGAILLYCVQLGQQN